ncbi:MAG: toxin-antitoxin system YwqK family antitoxin [Cyclobacteriaceae bacterium]
MKLKILLLLSISFSVFAQEKDKDTPFGVEGQFTFETERPYKLLELDAQTEEPIVTKKVKPKKNVYYGIKTKKRYTKKGSGERVTLELFYVLKVHEPPPQYVKDVYWYDYKRREIRRTEKFDPKYGALLHGPYKKMLGETILEEGIFFKGARHGRWMRYTREGLLDDKEKYYKGWPKESMISYYDTDRKKVKELIPVEYGEREGNYFMFHENGLLAVQGEYRFNHRVGDWVENYPNGKRKKLISYGKDPFDKDYKPFIRKEWDENGKEVYSSRRTR